MTRLEEIKRRAEQATPGPWVRVDYISPYSCVLDRDMEEVIRPCYLESSGQTRKDHSFIAASREDIPYLLELVERMRECLNKNLHDLHLSNHALNRNGYHPMFKAVEETEDLLAELDQPVQEKKH